MTKIIKTTRIDTQRKSTTSITNNNNSFLFEYLYRIIDSNIGGEMTVDLSKR